MCICRLKNIGLIAQALYHSSVDAKARAIVSGAIEAVNFRDDTELPKLISEKNPQIAELAYSFATLHLFSMFYGKHSLLTALESLLGKFEKSRHPYYYAAAYSMLNQEDIDEKLFSEALKNIDVKNSPEGIAFGGYLENRERLLTDFIRNVPPYFTKVYQSISCKCAT